MGNLILYLVVFYFFYREKFNDFLNHFSEI